MSRKGLSLSSALGEWERQQVDKAKASQEILDATYHGDIQSVQKLLEQGGDIYATRGVDQLGLTHLAAMQGHSELLQLLLSNKADPNAKDASLRTPLYWAAIQGRDEIVNQLLGFSNPWHADSDGETPLVRCKAIGGLPSVVSILEEWTERMTDEMVSSELDAAHKEFTEADTIVAALDARTRVVNARNVKAQHEVDVAHREFIAGARREDIVAARGRVLNARATQAQLLLDTAYRDFKGSDCPTNTLAVKAQVITARSKLEETKALRHKIGN